MQPTLLTYHHVEISYHGVPVVKDVSFTLRAGEILGIVGESGSGKSALVKAAMGLLGPEGMVTQGDISYEGRQSRAKGGADTPFAAQRIDLLALPAHKLRALCGPELGMVFQNCLAALMPIRRIGDQVYESMAAHQNITREESDKCAYELLERLNFAQPRRVLNSYPFELSGGMGQRVGIALSMLLEPKILLADEPTSALDSVSQKQVIEELLLLRKRCGTALVVVTHNIGVVRAMADSVLVLRKGQVEEYGSTDHVLCHSRNDYTRALMLAAPRLKKVNALCE